MSEKSTNASSALPEFLTLEQAPEIEDTPLQVLLLTMELREHRLALMRLAEAFEQMAATVRLPPFDFEVE